MTPSVFAPQEKSTGSLSLANREDAVGNARADAGFEQKDLAGLHKTCQV